MSSQTQLPSTPPGKVKESRWPLYTTVILAVIALILIGVYVLNLPSKLNPPRPEIISMNSHDGFIGLNYVIYVDATVRNNGGEGWVKVIAELWCGGYEKQEQEIYMKAGETRNIQFTFDVRLFQCFSYQYRVNAVPT
jgi:hypothetical protein